MSFLLGRTTNAAQQRPPYSSPFGHQQARSEQGGTVLYDAEGRGSVEEGINDVEDELEAAFGGSEDESDRRHPYEARAEQQRGPSHGRLESDESGLMYADDSMGQEEAAALLQDGIAQRHVERSPGNRHLSSASAPHTSLYGNSSSSSSSSNDDLNGQDGAIALNGSSVTLERPTNASAGGYDFERDPYERSSTGRPAMSRSSSTATLPLSMQNARRNAAPPSTAGGLLAALRGALPTRFRRYGLLGNNAQSTANGRRQDGTLDHDDDDDDDEDWAAPPPSMPGVYGGGIGNDGVFSNMTAKPGSMRDRREGADIVGGDDEAPEKEIPPAYEMAVLDAAPPYFDTTVHATLGGAGIGGGGLDEILIEGLPVGNIFSFFWSLLVSMSFQFVGFLLTTLLATSHAARNGSRAGLGITLIQYGIFMGSQNDAAFSSDGDSTNSKGDWAAFWGGNTDEAAEGAVATPTASFVSRSMVSGTSSLLNSFSKRQNETGPWGERPVLLDGTAAVTGVASSWMSMLFMIGGWFLLVSSIVAYLKALRYAKALRDGGSSQPDSLAERGGLLGWAARLTGQHSQRQERTWGLPSRPAPPPVDDSSRPDAAATPSTGNPSTAGIRIA